MGGLKRLLLVETDPGVRRLFEQVAGPISNLESFGEFDRARAKLLGGTPDLVLANLRLREHNGLHLVYLIKVASLPTRAVLYNDEVDPFLAREAQRAGAFFERLLRLTYSLPAYLHADLPPLDRRDPVTADRRAVYRGGRRRSDMPLSGAPQYV